MEFKNPNKEISLHPNSFTQNNHNNHPSSSPQSPHQSEEKFPTLDPNSHSQGPSPGSSPGKEMMIRYRQCQRNHAAHLGSHVVDGCGEFMPSGEEGSHLALRCAACNCHRNFHRRESNGETTANSVAAPLLPLPPPAPQNMSTTNCYISFSKYHKNHLPIITPNNKNHNNDTFATATNPAVGATKHQQHHGRRATPVMMAFGGGGAAESSSDDLNAYGGQFIEQYGVSKKRFRTKFSQEQKDKMMEFAEKIGWRIQKQDDVQVLRFCHEVGVKRQVFKVWMHNNKQAMKKKQES